MVGLGGYLDVIGSVSLPFVLSFGVIFGENKKSKHEKIGNFGLYGPLRRSEGHPHCGEVLRRSEGLPHRGEAEGLEKAPPRVRQGVALLSQGEVLRRSEVTVH